jgi:hypothetical protein
MREPSREPELQVYAHLRQLCANYATASRTRSRGRRGINSDAMMAMNPATAENANAAV